VLFRSLLLALRADPDYHPLTSSSDPEVFRILCEARADLAARDGFGSTAVMGCCNEPCLQVLLENRADMEARVLREDMEWEQPSGATPLIVKAAWGDSAMVQALLARRANVHACTDDGRSALDLAAERQHAECAKMLVASILQKALHAAQGKAKGKKGHDHTDVERFLSSLLSTAHGEGKGFSMSSMVGASLSSSRADEPGIHAADAPAVFPPFLDRQQFELPADRDDVEVTKVLNCWGEERPMEEVFENLRAALRGDGVVAGAVKVEPVDPGELLAIPCDQLRYTQFTCGEFFRDGRSLEDTISDIVAGRLQPYNHPNFILRVIRRVRRDGQILLLSLENRRLVSAKEAQRRLRLQNACFELRLRVRVYTWDEAFDTYLHRPEALQPEFTGSDIYVRPAKQSRRSNR